MTSTIDNVNPASTDKTRRRSLAERMQPTSQAVAMAHDAFLRDAMDGARWERRGVLGRLTRS